MNNPEDSAAEDVAAVSETTPAPVRRNPLRRIGCGVLLLVWFLFMLLPCFFIVLATQQEIILQQGDLPGQEIRIRLITDIDQRGLGLWSTRTVDGQEGDICLITTVGYILWEGEGEPAQYCVCYSRANADAPWQPSGRDCPAD